MIGKEFPIEFWPVTLTPTNSGGETEVYDAANKIADFAEVSDLSENKNNGLAGLSQERGKKFKVDYRPSLEAVLNQKTLIKFDGVDYTVQTIVKERNKRFQFVIEGRARI